MLRAARMMLTTPDRLLDAQLQRIWADAIADHLTSSSGSRIGDSFRRTAPDRQVDEFAKSDLAFDLFLSTCREALTLFKTGLASSGLST